MSLNLSYMMAGMTVCGVMAKYFPSKPYLQSGHAVHAIWEAWRQVHFSEETILELLP